VIVLRIWDKCYRQGGAMRRGFGFIASLAAGITVASGADLTGRVTDPQEKFVVRAAVQLHHVNGPLVGEDRSGSRGEFQFANLEAGEYRLSAEAPGFAAVSRDVTVPPAGSASADLQFRELASQSQSVVITAKSLEPQIDLRNSEVFNRTLFTRDDQLLQQ